MATGRFRQLQTQAQLASVQDITAELAYYLSVTRPRTLQELALSSPLDLATELAQAQSLGLLNSTVDKSITSIRNWLGAIQGIIYSAGCFLPSETSVCDRPVPPNSHLENYYTYRFAPAGKTSAQFQTEIDAKNQWLAEVDDYLAGAPVPTKTLNFAERGLLIAGIHVDDLRPWGGSTFDTHTIDTLILLRDFIRENVRVIQLIQALTEGQEAYGHREFGLALSAYARAENWFTALSPHQDPPALAEIWWRNEQSASGDYKPSFLVILEQNPGDTSVQVTEGAVHSYYTSRQSASDPNTLLETLQLDWPDYHKWRLDSQEGSPGVPFHKFLYYVYNFMLPLLEADCYARLGNYCAALDHYFRAYQEAAFTASLDTARENTIVTGVEGAGGPVTHYPSLVSFSVTSPPKDRYYVPYLNEVEKRVVRLRVAETLLNWGDLHFRRNELPDAQARYAQVLRIQYDTWNALRTIDFSDIVSYRAVVDAQGVNPRAVEMALTGHQHLLKIARGLNFLGYPEDYVPIWTYTFLLTTARYFAERARQLGRDALQFLNSAEQELGNRRLLTQATSIAQGQLAVESRRVDEADASIQVAQAGAALADQRRANNESRKEELEAFGPQRQALGIVGGSIGGASSGASLGGAGGATGAAAGAVLGATEGGISAYISGCIEMQSQRNELERQRLELEKAGAMSQAEVNRAQIGASVARLARNVAALSAIFAQSNLEFAEAKTLNAEFWYQTSLHLADIASRYLEEAIGVSFLAEQAFEFTENRRLDVIRFDYSQSEGVLSADALLADLDSIEYERINGRLNKVMPVKQVVRLREKDFFGFAELKRTGSITFETPLFDFDLSHSGSFQQHIASVEVEVRALVPPEGISGTLRKAGLSYLRYRIGAAGTTSTPPNTATDWIENTPTNFRMAPVIQSDETLILSPFDVRRDGVVLRPDPGEQLRVFEGSGVGTTWTLSLRPCSNNFDFSTITDANLIVYYYSQYDDGLERAVSLERGKLQALGAMVMQQTRGFSLRELFPDEMYYLQNPPFDAGEDSWQQRTLHLDIIPGLFAPNQINRRLQGITLVFVGLDDYLDVHASLSTAGFNLPPAAFQAAEVDPRIRAALGQNQPPEAAWNLTLSAADNVGPWTLPGLYQVDATGKVVLNAHGMPIPDPAGVTVFDPAKVTQIKDIWLIFNYQFDLAGECGEPIIFWDHFWDSAIAFFANNGNVNTTAWSADNLNGIGAWFLAQGVMIQTAAGVQSIFTPLTSFDWRNVAITAQVSLPTVVGDSVGLAFRYTPPSRGQRRVYYLARLTQVSGSKLEIALDKTNFLGLVSTLQSVQSTALATMTNFELSVRVRYDQLEVYVNGRLVLRLTDGTINSGSIGLYASGAGIGFSEVLVSDLTER